jgi:ankyrin repeat protein
MKKLAIVTIIITLSHCGLWKPLDTPQNRALVAAVEKNDLSEAKKAIAEGADPDVPNVILGDQFYSETPLSIAAINGHLEMVKYLVSAGASAGNKPLVSRNASPLLWAVKRGHDTVAVYLLEKGADPNYRPVMSVKGEKQILDDSPLVYCVKDGNVAMVRKLLDKGADPKIPSREGVPLLVMTQSYIGMNGNDSVRVNAYRDIATLLMTKGVSVNDNGPLGVAVKNNDIEGVRQLLDKGANINEETPNGVPLIIAIKKGHVDMAAELIRRGASLDNPVIFEEGLQLRDTALLKLLIDKGIPLNIKSRDGVPILIRAIECSNSEIAAYMVRKGADLGSTDKEGKTPLMYAAFYCMEDLVSLMLKKGANRNARARDGKTVKDIEYCPGGPDDAEGFVEERKNIRALIENGPAE